MIQAAPTRPISHQADLRAAAEALDHVVVSKQWAGEMLATMHQGESWRDFVSASLWKRPRTAVRGH
jgi:hypothetical protein